MNLPQHAMVLRVDEKSSVQALDRTHGYRPIGTTSLFAAFDFDAGGVIGRCFCRHQNREFLKILDHIEANVTEDLDIRIGMNNYSARKTKEVRGWFTKRLRWHTHFTLTSTSSLNQVERFLADLTANQNRRGVHRSTKDFKQAITTYIVAVNEGLKPFLWHKPAVESLAGIKRFRVRTL